jgi:uncharacterized protein (TIGR02117 family)
MRAYKIIVVCLLLTPYTGCQSALAPGIAYRAATETPAAHAAAGHDAGLIQVVSNGWHTGIVLARSDLPPGEIPEINDFPRAKHFEFSWGDARYFPAPEKDLGMVMTALFIATPAVVHLAGLPAQPREVFPDAEIVELQLSAEGLQKLVTYIDDSFDRSSANSGFPGLYRFSRFYPATGRFHIFETCNTWTARGLKTAGIPLTVGGTLQAEELMAQLR